MPWSAPFDQPIRLRGGRKLATLQQAADYIMKLPEDVQRQERWQIAVENLINAAESGGGWLMFARIGVMRALNGDARELTAVQASQLNCGRANCRAATLA
jgi:hypothetical protein